MDHKELTLLKKPISQCPAIEKLLIYANYYPSDVLFV